MYKTYKYCYVCKNRVKGKNTACKSCKLKHNYIMKRGEWKFYTKSNFLKDYKWIDLFKEENKSKLEWVKKNWTNKKLMEFIDYYENLIN